MFKELIHAPVRRTAASYGRHVLNTGACSPTVGSAGFTQSHQSRRAESVRCLSHQRLLLARSGQNRSRFIRLAGGCEASHDLVDAVRVVHRLTVYLACVFRKTLPKCRDRYAPIVKAPATSARQVGFGPITTG
jgi:hypothetical protein